MYSLLLLFPLYTTPLPTYPLFLLYLIACLLEILFIFSIIARPSAHNSSPVEKRISRISLYLGRHQHSSVNEGKRVRTGSISSDCEHAGPSAAGAVKDEGQVCGRSLEAVGYVDESMR